MEQLLRECIPLFFALCAVMGFAKVHSYYRASGAKKLKKFDIVGTMIAAIGAGSFGLVFFEDHEATKPFAYAAALICAFLGIDFLKISTEIIMIRLKALLGNVNAQKEKSIDDPVYNEKKKASSSSEKEKE